MGSRDHPAGEEWLRERFEAGRTAWPAFPVPFEAFAAQARGAVPLEAGATPQLHVGDLYLACACARGVPGAAEALERHAFAAVRRGIARMGLSPDEVDEVLQALRQHALVGPSQGAPKIGGYSGQGPVAGWLRATAARLALRLKQGAPRRAPVAEDAELLIGSESPELAYIQERYRGDFEAAFREALAGLEAKERTVLRMHLVDGLNIDRIGAVFQVHRSTVARWIALTRERLVEETRERVKRKLALDTAELESLMGLVRSRLDLSINGFLASKAP